MSEITNRKRDHIEIGLKKDVSMKVPSGYDQYSFMHQALPEYALEDVSLETTFLGKKVAAPLLISSMTGGGAEAETINRHLGEAAQALGLPMAVGSERVIFEHPEVIQTFKVARDVAPDVPIYGNMGAVQLNYGITPQHIQEAVDVIDGDGIFLHLNPLQEVVQTGGDTNFRGLLDKIEDVCSHVNVPILVKEVGCGIAPNLAVELEKRGVKAIDISGAGGTSWASIEALRAKDPVQRRLGEVFSDWGIPSALCLSLCRDALPKVFPLIASGGVRTGLDVAKAIALGADMAAFAMPLLKPATESSEAVIKFLKQIMDELRVAMFLSGARDIESLKAITLLQQ
jgi:isopentenyl-diphosphate Delta-isomerase